MAWETMWKMGPECAAQQAKWVSPMAHTGHARKIEAPALGTLERPAREAPAPRFPTGAAVSGAFLSKNAEGITTSQARSPRSSNAVRQSNWSISQRASGDSEIGRAHV